MCVRYGFTNDVWHQTITSNAGHAQKRKFEFMFQGSWSQFQNLVYSTHQPYVLLKLPQIVNSIVKSFRLSFFPCILVLILLPLSVREHKFGIYSCNLASLLGFWMKIFAYMLSDLEFLSDCVTAMRDKSPGARNLAFCLHVPGHTVSAQNTFSFTWSFPSETETTWASRNTQNTR